MGRVYASDYICLFGDIRKKTKKTTLDHINFLKFPFYNSSTIDTHT